MPPHAIFQQGFRWDAGSGSAQYTWGQDGFLKIDGSHGKYSDATDG